MHDLVIGLYINAVECGIAVHAKMQNGATAKNPSDSWDFCVSLILKPP